MADLATNSKTPRKITLARKSYLIPPLAFSDLSSTIQWIKENRTGPLDTLGDMVRMGVPPESMREVVIKAYADARNWPPRFGSVEWAAAFDTLDGLIFLLTLGLRRGQPDLTDEEIKHVADNVSVVELSEYIEAIHGVEKDPKKVGQATSTKVAGQPRS